MFVVQFIEFERGWGSKLDSERSFDTEQEAKDYVTDYNLLNNNDKVVPDWYMLATYIGYKPDTYELKE